MKIQVCRNCGNRNTVVSRALTSCNYCGSEDLEPITDTKNPNAATTGGAESSSGKGKWIILLLLLLLVAGGAFWYLNFAPLSLGLQNDDIQTNQSIISQSAKPNNSLSAETKGDVSKPIAQADNVVVSATLESNDSAKASLPPVKVKEVSTQQESIVLDVKPENAATNQSAIPKQPIQQALPEVKAEAQPLPKPVKKVVVQEKIEAKKIVNKPVERKVNQPVSVAAPKVAESKTKIKAKVSEDEKTIAELKRKLEEYKKQTVEKTEQKLSKETRLSMRVLDRQKGIVTDAKTGLMWMACSIGQEWANGSCVGSAEEYLWTEAADLAKDSGYAGYNDWRLPTREELNSIVYCSNGRLGHQLGSDGKMQVKDGEPQNGKCLGKFQKPTIDKRVFPNASGSTYWSYSRNAQATYNAWAVFFNGGYQYSYNTTNLGLVRLVRNSR
ncbi:DUF1566 domain-containing protein [Thiomicrorhabdus sp. Kp2]|uniref:Lcl domain-containing protein n=1 Tax=Thiomicrorhabdus sp. Kp2 TaxID=1123518 RepID=UPI000685B4D5|nr:DUF1566 domain-containing protein [Thiomicrorhabdus sp. Kp2]